MSVDGLPQVLVMLRARRELLGLRQCDVARRMEVTGSHLCRLEQGQRRPSLATLSRWARVLGLSPDEVVRIVASADGERAAA